MTNTKKKRHVCTYENCTFSTSTKCNFENHKRTHTGEKPFLCKEDGCGFACSQVAHLIRHRSIHTGEKPFVCKEDGCKFACARKDVFVIHMRYHSGEKPYVCNHPECGLAFSQSAHLITHKRRHTGEKPFVCNYPECDYETAQTCALKAHKRIHTGEKPYVCDYPGCDHAAAVSCQLVVHKRTHTGEKPFKCEFPECGYAATQSSQVKGHFKAMHTVEGVQRRKKQEERVAQALTIAGIGFTREERVQFACEVRENKRQCAYLDFVVHSDTCVIVVEVDEEQHAHYPLSCELARMADVQSCLMLGGDARPLLFIRYNPHAFSVNGIPVKLKKCDRELKLVEHLRLMTSTTHAPFAIHYMYYDSCDGKPVLCADPDWNPMWDDVVTTII